MLTKNKISIAHEAPVSLMNEVQQVTDYDYALSVCFDKVDGYYDFFKRAIKNGRWVLLDNGIFEEGVPMDADKYADYIVNLQPNEYVVPDALEDANTTVSNFDKWILDFGDIPGRRIGVAQGKTFSEFIECYKFMADKADKIAISFDYSFYINELTDHTDGNKWERYSIGRKLAIEYLRRVNLLKNSKPHHLLGVSLPAEIEYYKRVGLNSIIESFDSSNPVVHAIKRGRYPSHINTIDYKESTKLKDLINTPKTDKLLVDTITNIIQFRCQNQLH